MISLDERSRPWAWAGLSVVALAIAFLTAFAIATTLLSWAPLPNADEGLRFDLALFLILFGVLGMLGVLIAGHLALGRWLDVRAGDIVLPSAGIALAVAEELALHEWAEASVGYYDSDFIGWTAGLSFTLVALAVARFGVAVAPEAVAAAPRIFAQLAAVLVIFIVLTNVPELGNGIGPHSWPIAILIGAAGLYAVAAVGIGLARRWRNG